ncbi:alpha/beta hydrolase [Alkalicoccobacillus plakortidis]|uniref:Alpha/beta fold hydrolase n=1 Tax=Alkalicoccobacillus plakortidis TaxID=444060 RepID=A0ABT0XJ35_9BACI|nr:alpha/beta hydrolase [Alkalicoccobacillus plakortidis]MCM2675921.1 alpha/beta fold hydrolase [Alkalicoccobacillus plakortidis]
MPTIQIGEQPIHYYYHLSQSSEADTIVFAHGAMTNYELFDDLLPFFITHFHVLVYDHRGYGGSVPLTEPLETLSLDLFASDLHVLLQSLGISSGVHLAGFHLGALTVLRYAVMFPDEVKSLCLMTLPCTPPHLAEQLMEHRLAISNQGTFIPEEYVTRVATNLPETHPRIAYLQERVQNLDMTVFNQVLKLVVFNDPLPDLRAIEKPTMIMSGANDVLFPSYYLNLHAVSYPHCRFVSITNAASFIVLDRPEPVARKMMRFMNVKHVKKTVSDPFIQHMDETMRAYVEQIHQTARDQLTVSTGLRVDVLFQFKVTREGKELLEGWNKRFSKQILLYLLFHRSTTREQLCEELWPSTPIDKAKKNLRVYLNYLKGVISDKEAEQPYIVIDREHIHLTGLIESDALAFTTLLHKANLEEDEKEKIQAR